MSNEAAPINRPPPAVSPCALSGWRPTAAPVKMQSRAVRSALVLAAAGLALSLLGGCAPGPNELAQTTNAHGAVAGFWLGLWHGMIVIVTFVISLFAKNVHLYEVHNSGAAYNAGFLLGACMSLGGGSHGASRRPKKDAGRREAAPRPEPDK